MDRRDFLTNSSLALGALVSGSAVAHAGGIMSASLVAAAASAVVVMRPANAGNAVSAAPNENTVDEPDAATTKKLGHELEKWTARPWPRER